MAHNTEMMINGVMTEVTVFDHTAQQIDDAVVAASNSLNKAGGTMNGLLKFGSNGKFVSFNANSLMTYCINDDTSKYNGYRIMMDKSKALSDALSLARYVNDVKTEYNILHTGNKPSGSYTGNGSASERSIPMGGAVGNAVLIWSDNGSVIVTRVGGVGSKSFGYGDCHFEGDYTKIASTDSLLNANGVTYKYQVL